ncbi:uncharacterized protein G2W53_043552 [Senna tora]|uniref:Uncharacterized protein n=1 Tax=Senna tora TaxID=362788 RepID=A0A834W3I3_9FABA|nr:uncharacterized protein G2W53_043552 [Senna tora]
MGFHIKIWRTMKKIKGKTEHPKHTCNATNILMQGEARMLTAEDCVGKVAPTRNISNYIHFYIAKVKGVLAIL